MDNGIERIEEYGKLENKILTGKILEAAFEVSNTLGAGFVESVYQKALLIALNEKGLRANAEVSMEVEFRGSIVGRFFADVVINDLVIVELKAVDNFTKEHFAQILNYLKASGLKTGLIINFGRPKIECRRFDNRFLKSD